MEQVAMTPKDLKVKIFADGADYDGMIESYANPLVSGFTTNPTLMEKLVSKTMSRLRRKFSRQYRIEIFR